MRFPAIFVVWVLVSGLFAGQLRAALPFISEIMPDNSSTLTDEDGNYPDWIEIFNPGPANVNLQGWFLTDTPARLTNWAFPSVNLSAGSYLVVFASGKNRTNDPTRLHTSFQLDAGGEYLALVQPDGVTIASAFSPAFPHVKENVSFGIAQSQIITPLLGGSTGRILVPANASDLPANWNLPAYVPDARWSNAVAPPAIGFDTNQTAGLPSNVAPSGTAIQSSGYNGNTYPATLAINNILTDFSHTATTDSSAFWQVSLTNEMAIFEIVIFNRGGGCCQWRLRDITVEIVSTNLSGPVTNWVSPLLNPENVLGSPPYLSNNLVQVTGGPVFGRTVIVHRKSDPDNSGAGTGTTMDDQNVLSLGEVRIFASGAPGLRPYFTTDIQALMWNQNSSAFIRLPFLSTNTPDTLNLTTRYDDGFIAYLNGVEVARRNAPASPQWNSAATADRPLTSAVQQETIDVSAGIGALVNGTNILGIQLLNSSAADANALIQPELAAIKLVITTNVYFVEATPGTNNNAGWYLDEVADTHFSVNRGFFTNSFTLEITNATPGSQIYYSLNSDEPGPGKGTLYTGPIVITNTTVVRTRAFRANWKPTDVDTATYIFLSDVTSQVPNWPVDRIPPRYFPASWGANTVDYGMDPNVVSLYTPDQWHEALTQIPTISIVTEMPNLFDATIGIYANASGQGELWERAASIELLDPSTAVPGRFQANCGLRIRGGFSRNPQFVRHALRVFFRAEYGTAKLKYPMFENEGADEFDTFDLRNSSNYAWWRENPTGTNDTFVREVWCRQTLGAMGQPYRRSRYYHLYLNGQYWGISETDERPEASYGETYFGGNKTNYDVVKCGNRGTNPNFATEATDGNLLAWSNLWVMTQVLRTNAANSNYFRILGQDPDGVRNTNFPVLLDVDNLIDYMLEIFYSGDGDATLSAFLANNMPNNWFGMRDRTNPEIGFRFFNSDCEHTLGANSSQVDRTGPFGGSNEGNFTFSNPQWMHEELMRNPEYRVRFGDHVQKHFFHGGALTLEACTNRWWGKAVQITKAIRAYSARWGDAIREPPFGESNWTNTLNWVANTWFPPRGGIVLAQLTNDLLFPTISAPSLNSYGGFVSDGFSLTMTQTNAGGVIYYTTDGTDPRLVGGATSPAATAYGAPVTVLENTSVRARVKVGTNWSAVIEALFTTAQYFRDLAVTEIMYNPPGTTNVSGDEFEFLELKNVGTNNLNLSGLSFSAGISFSFTNGTRLAPGTFFVLARNKAQFESRYPGVPVNGVYSGKLDNGGETISLGHSISGPLLAVSYDDGPAWPQAADGLGFSLVPANPAANLNSDQPQHWRASTAAGGSPGADDPAPSIPAVVINEILTHSLNSDFIELHNPTAGPVNVGGWFLTDDPALPKKFRIPDGTMIGAHDYLVILESAFNPVPGVDPSFTLGAEGERVFLFSADAATTNLTGYSHGFGFGAAAEEVSFGRYITSAGEEEFPAQLSNTPGSANAGPLIAEVVINEIHYHPRPGGEAFVEIKNRTANPVALYDTLRPTNTWRLNGIDFVFPTNVVLGGGARALIVESEPAAFRARYNVPAAVPIFGPYGGSLQNSGELLELQRLDFRGTNNYAWVTMDAVRYNDRPPWPAAADGAGASLQRIDPAAYGNDPINWLAAAPSRGTDFAAGGAPSITQQPLNVQAVQGNTVMFSVSASGAAPLDYQWQFNANSITGANNSVLILSNVAYSQAGAYRVIVLGNGGSVESTNAMLTVLVPATITLQPTNQDIRIRPDPAADVAPATNASFTVAATTLNPPLTYQWRFNGTNLSGSAKYSGVTATTLTVSNVAPEDFGDYTCALTDLAGTISTLNATLYPLVRPTILYPSANQTQSVVAGSAFPVSAVLNNGWPPPFGYTWRSNSLNIGTQLSSSKTNYFIYPASAVSTNALTAVLYRLIVTNRASPQLVINIPFYITTLLDSDHDGIPDVIETALGLNPNDPADAAGDSDADGMSNLAEYQAGTDPTNAASYLRIEQTIVPGQASVNFAAVSNRTYTVQYSDELSASLWQRLADVISRPTNRVEVMVDPAWRTNRFYRVVTPRQP